MRIGTMHTKLIRKEICTSNALGRNDTPQNVERNDALLEKNLRRAAKNMQARNGIIEESQIELDDMSEERTRRLQVLQYNTIRGQVKK